VIFWHNISVGSLIVDLVALPFIAAGAFIGLKIVGKMPEKLFRYFVLVMTGVTAAFLLI